jgi:hypothetical protein
MLLAADRPYREYQARWVADHLQALGCTVTGLAHFKIRYRESFLHSQLQICEDRVERFDNEALATAMRGHIACMRRRGEDLIKKFDENSYELTDKTQKLMAESFKKYEKFENGI